MNFTDDELTEMYDILYDQYYYGEELIYQDSDRSRAVSSGLAKIEEERKRRRRA